MAYEQLTRGDLIRLLEQHDAERAEAGKDGIIMSYTGRTAPWQIIRQVKPKLTKINQRVSEGDAQSQGQNIIMDGENLSAMVTLYKYRGQIDLILTDPPYNTGEDFRYNDKWDKDPNDPDLGEVVPKDDGSRHSKWLRFMTPRLWMMREMLKPGGVIAICIDHRELYRLGMLMDEVFREENRIGIINWQKSYAPKSDSKHISTATEYVLIYSKDAERSKTHLEERTAAMDAIYDNPDDDPEGLWDSKKTGGNPTAASGDAKAAYGIQSPFTGEMYYPGANYWRSSKKSMKEWLEEWGSEYEEKLIGDDVSMLDKNGKTVHVKALVLKGCKFAEGQAVNSATLLKKSRIAAQKIYDRGQWPKLFFTKKGDGAPRLKTYLKDVKKGKVPLSWWSSEDYDTPFEIGSASWAYTESGHSQSGIKELAAVVGLDHGFQTVKPLRLIKKIIQLWCKPDGLVLDPFAGSGTTAHAVLELNAESPADRRFILIEQGNTDKGDHYAKTLTAERVRRVVKGDWKSGKREPLGGGFQFIELKRQQVDAAAVNALQREEMIDLLLTSHWEKSDRAKTSLMRFTPEVESRRFLFATNSRNEGFFLIWDGAEQPSDLNRATFKAIVEEAIKHGLSDRYHVYASVATYSGRTVEFYKIPDRVLEHIGFNTRADAYNNDTEGDQG
jgi:adenine-specific DNA-methyltransferase